MVQEMPGDSNEEMPTLPPETTTPETKLISLSNWQFGQALNGINYTIKDQEGYIYSLIETLGEGGFGITYLAKNIKNNKVVIKTLKYAIKSHKYFQKFKESFYNEALKLARFHNPHIVQVIKIIHVGELPCIVMEYIKGKTLAEIVRTANQPLKEPDAIKYIQQIGKALIEVHSQNWLHRDVKPQNIIIREDTSSAVLIDFGIAREYIPESDDVLTAMYSPGYSPIEQYNLQQDNLNYQYGFHSDIYALAATLYYALTGKIPIAANERISAQDNSFIPPKAINIDISDKVNLAIIKGMEVEPKYRPQSMQMWLNMLVGNGFKIKNIKNIKFSHRPIIRNFSSLLALSAVTVLVVILLHQTASPCFPLASDDITLTICKQIKDVPDVPKGLFKFTGSTTFTEKLNENLKQEIKKKHPYFILKYIEYDSRKKSSSYAINRLIEEKNVLSFVQTSLPPNEKAQKLADNQLKQFPIAHNFFALFVNNESIPKNFPGLTVNQVRDILKGKIKNWKEVGGNNHEIIIIMQNNQSNPDLVVDKIKLNLMGGQESKDAQLTYKDPKEVMDAIAKIPGSITSLTASRVTSLEEYSQGIKPKSLRILPIAESKGNKYISLCPNNNCKASELESLIRDYPNQLMGELYIVISTNNEANKKAGIAFVNMLMSDEGQDILSKAGFIPIRFGLGKL